MYVGNKPTSGMRLWDIRFKGERIVYELSLQEEMAGGWPGHPSHRGRRLFVLFAAVRRLAAGIQWRAAALWQP
jgi:hypothetical protein